MRQPTTRGYIEPHMYGTGGRTRLLAFLTLMAFACSTANAAVVNIKISETRIDFPPGTVLSPTEGPSAPPIKTEVTFNYAFDTKAITLKSVDSVSGTKLPKITKYDLKPEGGRGSRLQLYYGSKFIAPGDAILYQSQIDGDDLVVLTREHNSISSPLKAMAAVMSHPDQVTDIFVYALRDGEVKGYTKIYRHDPIKHTYTANDWRAEVLK